MPASDFEFIESVDDVNYDDLMEPYLEDLQETEESVSNLHSKLLEFIKTLPTEDQRVQVIRDDLLTEIKELASLMADIVDCFEELTELNPVVIDFNDKDDKE